MNLETTVVRTVTAPITTAFDYIAPINLAHIFRGSALIPAVVDSSIKAGWNKAGLVRTIRFADGSSSQETLLTIAPPTAFSYQNEHFTSPVLRVLLKRLVGDWRFTDVGNNQTRIEWTYRAIPQHFIARMVIEIVLMRAIRSMLENALTIAATDLESGQLAAGQFAP